MKQTKGEKIFAFFNYTFLALLAILMLYPFWNVLRISLSTAAEANSMEFRILPSTLCWDGYNQVFHNNFIWSGYGNTILRVILALAVRMTLMILTAYPLSKRYLPHRDLFTALIIFTMFFTGGMIPGYLNIKSLGLIDNFWVYILPSAIDTYTMIIIRNFFMALPEELEESARIDGASTMRILISLVIPLSVPILMTAGLWTATEHWNAWFDCIVYMNDYDKYVLQAVLQKIIADASAQFDGSNVTVIETAKVDTQVVKCASIIVSTLPIMCVYPFIQKYFVKGVMVGSLKG